MHAEYFETLAELGVGDTRRRCEDRILALMIQEGDEYSVLSVFDYNLVGNKTLKKMSEGFQ